MATAKGDVIWSPVHHDKFIVWGPDITLYEVARLKEIEKKTTFTQISPTRGATVVASQSASGVRCVEISAIAEQPDPLLALGHANGKVTLATLKQTYDPLGLSGREFVPKYTRPCNSVSWSHVETNLLASALDKHRSDHCVLLWDVNRGMPEDQPGTSTKPATELTKPLAEMALSETAHNVSWSHCSNRTLLASMNLKHIKIFDLRDLSNKAVSMTTSRYLYGACSDPFNSWQIASRGDNVVCIWDARAFDRPLLTLPQPKAVVKIQWCPSRRNLLMSLQRDSTTIRLHDIQQANSEQNSQAIDASAVEAELEEQWARGGSAVERDVSAGSAAATIAAAAWHPQHPQRFLALTHTGALIDHTEDFYAALRDVSFVMRGRASTDYGLKPDLWQNADLADDEVLSGLWHFLALSKSLVEDGCIRNSPWKHPGVRTVLRSPGDGGYRSEMVPSLLPDLPNRRVTIYRSAERSRALQLCGWGWGWENAGAGVERLEAEGTPCRAAALAAFHLRLRTAIDVLARAHEPQGVATFPSGVGVYDRTQCHVAST
ncbi:GATOR complex protein MIOS [Phthorimaea operculella]|nr:GATOR complex protein MIOS [Phthorimaea operculella]